MPGHARAALAAYPNYSCTGIQQEVPGLWGVFDDIFCSKEESILFLQDILSEIIPLFPSKYIHIGGDEAPKTRWKKCDKCQAIMKENKLKDEHELQSYFIQRMDKFLVEKGKKLIGWDEILEGGLSPNAAVMSWRGFEGGIEAAKLGHEVVMSPGSHCYFDHYQGKGNEEPLAIGGLYQSGESI
jgi:hexosaminidase